MRKPDINKKNLMRINEVVKASGVSIQTIHYYLREGLLTPPVKTARNMAYYEPVCVEEIRLIKELQVKKFLPLSVIKLVMKAKHEGQDVDHVAEMRSFLDELFHPLETEGEPKSVSLTELAAATGLPVKTLKSLEKLYLLLPDDTPQGKRYDSVDVRVGQIVKRLLYLGLTLPVLGVYSRYVEALRSESKVVHDQVLHPLASEGKVSIAEVVGLLNSLKSHLAAKVYRQTALELHR